MIRDILAILGALVVAKIAIDGYDKYVKRPVEKTLGNAIDDLKDRVKA